MIRHEVAAFRPRCGCMMQAWRQRCALLAVGVGSFGAHAELALPDMPPPLPPCGNDKIAVEEECPGGIKDHAGEQTSWVAFHAQLYDSRAAIFASDNPFMKVHFSTK